MTQKRLLSIPLLALVVLSVLAPQARSAMAQSFDYSTVVPEWGDIFLANQSYDGVDTSTSWTSLDLCGRPDDLMGFQVEIYNSPSANLGIGVSVLKNGNWSEEYFGGPKGNQGIIGYDTGYGYYLSNPPSGPWADPYNLVAYNPLGTSVSIAGTTSNYISGNKYANGLIVSTGPWGGGSRNISIKVVGLCSNTGTPPTPTPTPECDETDLSCKARHYWPMDEKTTGATRVDTLGGANLDAATVRYTEHSKFGPAAAELASNQTMSSLTNPETLSVAAEGWSMAGWIRPQGAAGDYILAGKGLEYTLSITATNYITFTAGGASLTSPEEVIYDAWHLITVIFDGTTYKLQVDTQAAATGAGTSPPHDVDTFLFGWDYSGRMDEWTIWERAITDAQRTQLWNNGGGCFYPFTTCAYLPVENKLTDGGMEEHPLSSAWYTNNGVDFNGTRINRSANWLQWFLQGPAKCGDGYHVIKNDGPQFAPTAQDFTWSGGDLYWKIGTRGARGFLGIVVAPALQPLAYSYLEDETGNIFVLIEDTRDSPQSGEWKANTGMVEALPAGNYKIVLTGVDEYIVSYDDVEIDTAPITTSCSVVEEPTPTVTPTATRFATATQEVYDPTQSAWTVTPGPSPTPSSLIISNCGFQNGSVGWTLNYQSFIGNSGGPIGPLYLVAQGGAPSAYQTVYVSSEQTIYLTAYVLSYAQIRMVNVDDGSIITFYSAHTSTWTQIRRSMTVRSGYWRLELNNSGYSSAGFDGIDLSKNGYTSSGACVNTPTAGPTAFVAATSTLTRTATNAPTQTAVYISSTPGPTRTPYGTPGDSGGPYTTTPNASQLTATAGWIITATYDAGAIGTYTPAPAPSGTPGGTWNGGDMPPGEGGGEGGATPTMPSTWNPGDPPPASDAAGYWENVPCTGDNCSTSQTSWIPGLSLGWPNTGDLPTNWFGGGDGSGSYEFHECVKPTNPWSVSWWIDYERCLIFSFFSWGPKQHGLVSGIPATFTQLEPFGTIAEVGEGMVIMRTQVAGIQNEIGYDGVNDPINPGEILGGSIGNDPWGENAQLHLFDNTGGITTGAYTGYCTHRLSDALSGNLANGACFALNVMKNVGVFPWVQFMINVASILSIVVSAFKIIGVAGSAAVVYAPTGDDEEVE